jgi:hypothetical protein
VNPLFSVPTVARRHRTYVFCEGARKVSVSTRYRQAHEHGKWEARELIHIKPRQNEQRQARDKSQNQPYHNPRVVRSPPRPREVRRPLTLASKPLTREMSAATKPMTTGMRAVSKDVSRGLNTTIFSLPEINWTQSRLTQPVPEWGPSRRQVL